MEIPVYTTPTRNFFRAFLKFMHALQNGTNARLMRVRNEDCSFPIRRRLQGTADEYTSSHGALYSINDAKAYSNLNDFERDLMMNWEPVFGEPDAAARYYKTGQLTEANLKGMGYCHYVKRQDIYDYLKKTDPRRAELFLLPKDPDQKCWMYPPKRRDGKYWEPVQFKHKVWAVVMVRGEQPNYPRLTYLFNIFAYPFKFIPRHSVLRMKEYDVHTFRVGAVTHGYSVDIHIPKKFSFNN